MNFLVTGGAGFIGSHLCEALLKGNHSIICIDNFNDYYSPKRKKENINRCTNNKNFKLFNLNICDFKSLRNVFSNNKIDQVIHLAAGVGVRASIDNPRLFANVNIGGTINILELCRINKINKIVFASSSSVYGTNRKVPFSESDNTNNIISPYAATKLSAELICKTYSQSYGLSIICLRFFTVYGPRGRPDMAIYKFTDNICKDQEIPIFGDGSTKRDYTFVSDIIDGIVSSTKKDLKFEIINLGNSQTVELNTIVSLIKKYSKTNKEIKIKKLSLQKGDVPVTYADINKAKKLLNYNPKVGIEEGIRKFIEWYKKTNEKN